METDRRSARLVAALDAELDQLAARIVLEAVYSYLGATSPKEMHLKYVAIDQPLFKNGTWDYNDLDQKINIVRHALEHIALEHLNDDERSWVCETLWFWYHHATSVALWWKKDVDLAKKFVAKAAELLDRENGNRVTMTLFFLLNGDIANAEKYVNESAGKLDYGTACEILAAYRRGDDFWQGKF